MEFDLAGHLRLVLRSSDPAVVDLVTGELDPYPPLAAADEQRDAGVILEELAPGGVELAELQLAAGDGFVTGSSGEDLYVVSDGRSASVPDALHDAPAHIRFEAGYPMSRLFRQVIRPTLQLRALAGGSVAMHAAAVEWHGQAVLVGGWSESGKTETALALMELGGSFLSDKWTLVGGSVASAAAFPIKVGVRRWALRYLPQLRGGLPRRARAQLAAARTARVVSFPLRSLGRGGMRGRIADGAERAVTLADRAALAPTEVAGAYGQQPILGPLPIGLVIVLRTVPHHAVVAREADPARVADRLAASALTERQGYFALRQRAAYAMGSANDAGAVAVMESERLLDILRTTPVVEVDAPFPTDPRRVVAAVQSWLPSPR
jgi:hypothetical protein